MPLSGNRKRRGTAEAVVAIDLGASSGRCVLAQFDGARLTLEELHRFPNHAIHFNGHLRWNVPGLFEEIKVGLRAAAGRGVHVRSVGVDTWGVDFGLLGPTDALLDLPISYRDPFTSGCIEQVTEGLSRDCIYQETGIQFLPFNTLFQLYARARLGRELLQTSRHMLMLPDLFSFLMSGDKSGEYTNASTTQMVSLRTHTWSKMLEEFLGIPPGVLPLIMQPGTTLSKLRPEIARETGLSDTRVTATASHDTASAIAGIPATESAWAYISCGTWSLVGQELQSPITTAGALARNFTNEAGVGNTIRFLKNIQGMWLLQECEREWATQGRAVSGAQLVRAAREARPFGFFVDPDDPSFFQSSSMLASLERFCRRTRQKFDPAAGAVARAVFESLALTHRRVLAWLAELTGIRFTVIHMVGGGSRNRLLCQWTADAAGLPLIAGPAEASCIGNAATQGLGLGWFSDLNMARRTIAASVPLVSYFPKHQDMWDDAEQRFNHILARAAAGATHH